MLSQDHEFAAIDQFVGGYFHQDVDLEASTIPEVAFQHANGLWEAQRVQLREALNLVEARHRNDLHEAFYRTFSIDVDPVMQGQDVAAFFAMVRAILADPSVYTQYETGKDF